MIDYTKYIYNGSFLFMHEDIEQIMEYLSATDQGDTFIPLENYELLLCYLIETNNVNKAKELLKDFMERFPSSSEGLMIDTLIVQKTDKFKATDMADKYFQETDNLDFLVLKSVLLCQQNKYYEADIVFDTLLNRLDDVDDKIDHLHQMALFLEQNEAKSDVSDEVFMVDMLIEKYIRQSLSYDVVPAELIPLATVFVSSENYRIAKLILNKIIDTAPYNKDVWGMLSRILVMEEQFAEAAETYKYRIAINDEDPLNYYYCGLCYRNIHKWTDALFYFNMQEEKYPNILTDDLTFYSVLKNYQSEALLYLEHYKEAYDNIYKVLDISPDDLKANILLVKYYTAVKEYQRALTIITKIINYKHIPIDYVLLYETIGDIFVDVSEILEAKYKKEYLLNAILAYNKVIINNNLTSKSAFAHNVEIQRLNIAILLKIGRVYTLLGDYSNALMYFQYVNYWDSETPTLNFFLTICYYKLGFHLDAFLHFAKIPAEEKEEYASSIPEIKEIEKEYGNWSNNQNIKL